MAKVSLQSHPSSFRSPSEALRKDWPLYLFEAGELAAFMISACVFTVLLFDPAIAPVKDRWGARALMGIAMGLTAFFIIKSPWGRRSGAHFNPVITVTFFRLGKIGLYDSFFYVAAHFLGAFAGVKLSAFVLGSSLALPQVRYAVTVPGLGGPAAAFAAETFMAALLMATVLYTSTRPRLSASTPYLMAVLISLYILFFAPVSGFSINPARSFGSAVFAHIWTGIWIYFSAPALGMMGAAEVFLRFGGPRPATAAKRPYFSHRHLVQREEA